MNSFPALSLDLIPEKRLNPDRDRRPFERMSRCDDIDRKRQRELALFDLDSRPPDSFFPRSDKGCGIFF